MREKIYLSSPHMGGSEESFIKEAFDSNWIAPLGPNVTHFESSLESYLNQGSHVAVLSSGTAAIHLALLLLGVERGDEVICQSMTFSASANPIVYVGAKPVFVDSEPKTWNICPESLEEAIEDRIKKGKKPKAIIAVHLYGMPYNVTAVDAVATKYEIPVIEDSAEALGSGYKNRKCGTFGELSILSFNGNKIITTSGGGALVSRSKAFKDRAIFLATQARDEAPHYQHSTIGYNYRLSNICAGIGRGQMEVLDAHVELRRKMNRFYQELFSGIDQVEIFSEPNNDYFSNHWLSCALFWEGSSEKTTDHLREAFLVDNIESRPLWKPMHLQPVFKDSPFYGSGVAENLFNRGICLPSGSNLGQHERDRIATVVNAFFK